MNDSRKKYAEIILLHCIGVIMIFFCHVAQRLNFCLIGEILTAGVPLFLFVSGFLTGIGQKAFDTSWLKRKCRRILVPYYALLVLVLILTFVLSRESLQWKPWLILFANIQGLTNYVFKNDLMKYYAPLQCGLGHFWFVTVIMLCYLLAVIVRAVYDNSGTFRKYWKVLLLFSFLIVQPFLVFYNLQLNYFNVFLWGFLVAKKEPKYDGKIFALATLAVILLGAGRLVCRKYMDDSLLYDSYIALLASDAVGIWIFVFVFYVRSKFPQATDMLSSLKPVIFLDSIIYEIFLVHHVIIKGSWSLYNWIPNAFGATLICIFFTIVFSLMLQKLSSIIK